MFAATDKLQVTFSLSKMAAPVTKTQQLFLDK